MYSSKPSVVYGFHGMDKAAALKILTQESEFRHSNNKYDWLGNGVYFWENNLERARQYAIEDSQRKKSSIKTPFVLGAVIELGNCLDLLDQRYNDLLKLAYESLKEEFEAQGIALPSNGQFGCKISRLAGSIAANYQK